MPRFTRRRQGARPGEATVVQPGEIFAPQAKITMTRDVVGKRENGSLKYQLKAGEVYYIDVDTAAEFITKGYASGELPREVDDREKAKWRSEMTVIRPGG